MPIMADEEGLRIQCKSNKLFSSFFSKQFISAEILKYQDETDDNTAFSILSLLRTDASKLKSPFKTYATQFVIQAIDVLVDNHTKINKQFLYSIMLKLASKGELNIPSIQDRVNNYSFLVPSHVIVELDKIGVISLILYFQRTSECSLKKLEWINQLFALALVPKQDPKPQEHDSLDHLLTAIIHVGFGELTTDLQKTISGQTVKFAVSLLNDLTKKCWDFLWENPEKELHAFEFPNEGLHLQLSAFKNCYLEQLAFLISYKPEIKPITAIKTQHDWTYFKSPKNVVNFIVQLLIPLEVVTVLEKIDEILNRYEINWKTLLLIVSTVQVCYPPENKHLKALINSFMQRALDNLQMEMLLASFLLARQINAENTSSHHYGVWFSSITSSSTSSKQFAFLLKFLTNIVRHEPAWVLLAHKNNPPSSIPIVDNCRTLWTDYSTLVRTRLEDFKLKQSCDQVLEDPELVKEVDSAISAFEKSDRRNRIIPKSFNEATIFHRTYFVNKFLPVLLKPRRIPDPPDVREEFIEELRKGGKLPPVQYQAYCTACQKLQNTPEIDRMDWQASDGNPSYKPLMNQIVLCNVARQQSQLIEQLDNILGGVLPPLESSTSVIKFNFDNNETKTKNYVAWKIAECWIDSLKSSHSTEKQLEWLNRYFLQCSRYPTFIESLYGLVWEFTHNCRGDEDTIRCYGLVIFLLCLNSHILLPVHHQAFEGAFSILLLDEDQLAMNKEDSILFHFRLFYYTVAEAKRQNQLDSVRRPSSLYIWLSRRIFHSQKMQQYKQYLALSQDVEFCKESKIRIRNWLKLEMAVDANMDVLLLSERLGYLHSVLQMDYQNVCMTELYTAILDSIIGCCNLTGRADCSKDLLLLLQSLLCKDQSALASDSSAWLIQYWLQFHHKKGNDMDQILWSVVCCLPPYLLSRNYYSQPIQAPSLKTLSNLIENNWRNTLTSESAWFPKFIASHLLSALEGTPSQEIPCLQFSAQIHFIHDAKVLSGNWRTLDKALNTFHPLMYNPQRAEIIQWSGLTEVDLLACQLMVLTAVVECAKGTNEELPLFIKELGSNISHNPNLLKAWKMTFWTGDDCTLPWKKIIPTYLLNLLPFVILRSLISWSDMLLLTVSDYLDALVEAHNKWNQTTHSFLDLENGNENQSHANYPVGNILDLHTLGRLGSDVKQILKKAPLHFLKTFQQSPCYRSMETDYQEIVKQRY